MKITGRGIVTIVVFLVAVPVLTDLLLSFMLPESGTGKLRMSSLLSSSYGRLLPLYGCYLFAALLILYVIRRYRQKKRGEDQE